MKKVLLVAAAISLLCLSVVSVFAYVETFDNNNAGWLAVTVNNGGGKTYPYATWHAGGGNPGGYVSGTVTNLSDRLYGLPPASTALYGDLTGQTMTTDYKIDGTVTGPPNARVRFYVGTYTGGYNYFVTDDTYSWDPNLDTGWTTHQVALLAANFIQWPNLNAGTKTFAQIIAAPEDIGLVFSEGFTNNATLGFTGSGEIGVDNFGTVPEPSSLIALFGGFGSLLAFRRRRA